MSPSLLQDVQDFKAASQDMVDIVVNWSREWKLVLNGSKIETLFFSLGKADKTWKARISINNQVVRFKPQPQIPWLHVGQDSQVWETRCSDLSQIVPEEDLGGRQMGMEEG